MTEGQAYQIDLDPVHSVIRLTVAAETVTLELAEDIYRHLSEVASSGGPYAAIFDFSAAKRTTIPTDMVRDFCASPSICPNRKKASGRGERLLRKITPHYSRRLSQFSNCCHWKSSQSSQARRSPGNGCATRR